MKTDATARAEFVQASATAALHAGANAAGVWKQFHVPIAKSSTFAVATTRAFIVCSVPLLRAPPPPAQFLGRPLAPDSNLGQAHLAQMSRRPSAPSAGQGPPPPQLPPQASPPPPAQTPWDAASEAVTREPVPTPQPRNSRAQLEQATQWLPGFLRPFGMLLVRPSRTIEKSSVPARLPPAGKRLFTRLVCVPAEHRLP